MKKNFGIIIAVLFFHLTVYSQITITVTPQGPTELCSPPWNVTMIASQIPPGDSYQWHMLTFSPQNGCGIDSAIVPATFNAYGASTSGFYYCEVLDQNHMSVTASYPPVFVKMLPQPVPVSTYGPPNNCTANNVFLCVGQHWEDSYNSFTGVQWMRNGVDIPGAIASGYTANSPGIYKCRVHNTCATAFSDSITVNMLPSATITPAGSTTFCSGSLIVLNANSGTGYTYKWKNNGTIISGATNQSYSATVTGSYTVVVTNSCGSATSLAVAVTVNALPSAIITPSGTITMCSGGITILNAPVAANRSYQWLKTGVNISGATLSSYTVTTGGTYKVKVTNTATGCSKTSAAGTTVTVNALPAATITPQGSTTFCAGGSVVLKANSGTGLTYKWKKTGAYISGATLLNYTATTAGTYRVQVTNSNSCSKTSAGVVVTVPCREDGRENEGINSFKANVYPNPSSGDFIFDFENSAQDKITISIFDITGRSVLNDITLNSQFTIRNLQLSPGIYSAVIIKGADKKILKLVKNP